MAFVTGTTWTHATASSMTYGTQQREDVEDVLWQLDPMDTWALSNLDKVSATGTLHEWLSDTLAAAATNIVEEGDDASYATASPAPRYGNYQQIIRKTFIVSDTLEEVKKIGRDTETGRLGVKLMKEWKRDAEYALVRNQISTIGGAGTGRSTAGMETWIYGPTASTANTIANVVAATTTAATATTPSLSTGGVPGTAITDGGTVAALTEGTLKLALAGAWEDGGDPRVILASATNKNAIDAFSGIATRFVDSSPNKQAAIVGAANMYVSSYGSPHMVVLSRYVRNQAVMCIDPDYWAVSFLRRPKVVPLAKTGDATKKMIIGELGLVCRAPLANGKVVSLTP
jgi:hypothetical protein